MAKTVSKPTKRRSMTAKQSKRPSKGSRMVNKRSGGKKKSHTKTSVRHQRKVIIFLVQILKTFVYLIVDIVIMLYGILLQVYTMAILMNIKKEGRGWG